MKKIIFALIVFFCCGCGHTWQPVCRHRAVFSAITVGEQYPVRIARGLTLQADGRAEWHAAAQVLIGDRWRELRVGAHAEVYDVDPDRNFYVIEYLPVNDYYNRYFAWHMSKFGLKLLEHNGQ